MTIRDKKYLHNLLIDISNKAKKSQAFSEGRIKGRLLSRCGID